MIIRINYGNCINARECMQLIGWKDGDNCKLLVDAEEIECLRNLSSLNTDADSIYNLYEHPSLAFKPGSIWNDIVFSPSRPALQLELKNAIQKVELQTSQ